MSPLIRQHRYALGVTLRRLLSQPFSSIANILVITLALAIPLLGATALMSLRPVANHLTADPEMTVFMQVSATPAETGAVADRIRRDHASEIRGLRVISRDRALAELKANPAYA